MLGLRRAALLAVVSGELAAAVADVLPLALLVLVVVVTVAGAELAKRAPEQRAVLLRRLATAACVVLALLVAPRLRDGGGEGGPRAVLGPLLVGVAAVQTLTWQRRRDLQTGILGALGLIVLGASFAPDILVGLPLLIGWCAALVGGALAVRARATEGVDVVLSASSPRSPVVAATALAAVLGLVGYLLLPVPEDAALRSRIAEAAQQVQSGGRGAPGAYTGDRVDLRNRGQLSDEPVIVVPADSPALWRSGVYTDWDGTSWTTSGALRRVSGPPFVVSTARGPTRTDEVLVERRADGPVWAPGPVVTVALRGRSAFVDDLGAVQGRTAPGYVVTSQVVAPARAELLAATGPDELDPRWTALPVGLPERVRALGVQLAGSARTRIEAVEAVERWLSDNATYNLDSPVPGPGEDAVDRFLFVDRVGFCEQFAAAEALLLRAAGIPTRFATGLAYGVSRNDGRRTFQQKNLHAWVEVFHPGIGWVASDPTPPATQLAGSSLRVRLVAKVTAALQRVVEVPGGRPALAVGLLLLTALVAAAAVLARRRRPVATPAAVAAPIRLGGRPALAAFVRFDARLGGRRRRPAESLGELRSRLDLTPEVVAAIAVVEEECYPAVGPGEAAASTAAAVLDRS